jgi:glycosyltransferase involved in cell wall biosynthesis
MSMSVTLLVPTLNEIEGMKHIMPQIEKDWCDQILVVDGRSTDGTVEYARAQGYDVIVQKKPGVRNAYLEVFPHVKGEMVVTFSPDGNSVPRLIPELARKIEAGYDMAIASRYCVGARSDDDDLLTAVGNWMFTKLINLLHGGSYTDAMVIFRAYRTSLFYDLDLDDDAAYATEKLFRTVIGVEPLLSIRAAKKKLKVCEIPGPEPRRIGGERKLQPFRWGAAYLLQVFRELYYWKP